MESYEIARYGNKSPLLGKTVYSFLTIYTQNASTIGFIVVKSIIATSSLFIRTDLQWITRLI